MRLLFHQESSSFAHVPILQLLTDLPDVHLILHVLFSYDAPPIDSHNYIHSFRFAQAQNVMKMFP